MVSIQMPTEVVGKIRAKAKESGLTVAAYCRLIIYNHEKERQG